MSLARPSESELFKQQAKDFAQASKTQTKEALKTAQRQAGNALEKFYDPLTTFNAYHVFWVVIMLLAVGIVVRTFMENVDYAVAGAAAGIVLLTTLGVFFRFYYNNKWSSLTRVNSLPEEFKPLPNPFSTENEEIPDIV